MPYKLSDDKKCVIRADTGAVVKCHDTETEAAAHLRALEANVGDAHGGKSAKNADLVAMFCQDCVRLCVACLRECAACPDGGPEHDACVAACRECVICCEGCLADCQGGASDAQCVASCKECAAACRACADACQACAAACPRCADCCNACARCCGDCAAACDENAGVSGDQPQGVAAMPMGKRLKVLNGLNLAYVKSLRLPDDVLSLVAVKRIGRDTLHGYSHLWGSDSLTDIETEYFTNKTDFWDKSLGKAPRPLTWDHAQDPDFKDSPVIGQIVDFGDDEVGRWYEAKLERSHRYRQAIDALIEAGKLGTSSDSAPQYVERVKTGKAVWLKTWPFFAAALTDMPCEPRMLDVGSPIWKSIAVALPGTRTGAPDGAELESLKRWFDVFKLSV